jgi:hypothetical protein
MEWFCFFKNYLVLDMYDVEPGFIWIWKYIEIFFDNWFEKHLNCF